MSLESNTALAHRLHQEILEKNDLDLADKIVAPDFVYHSPETPTSTTRGPEAAKEMARYDNENFPENLHFEHYNTLAQGDLVAFCWTMTATHKSGAPVKADGIDIIRIADDKIAEAWIMYDRGGAQQQGSEGGA